jgi:hypothetical protein
LAAKAQVSQLDTVDGKTQVVDHEKLFFRFRELTAM